VEYERHLAWSVMRGITQILGQRHGEVAARSIEAHLVKLVIAFPVEVGNSRCIRQCGRWLSPHLNTMIHGDMNWTNGTLGPIWTGICIFIGTPMFTANFRR
jgi:hypothetical protein